MGRKIEQLEEHDLTDSPERGRLATLATHICCRPKLTLPEGMSVEEGLRIVEAVQIMDPQGMDAMEGIALRGSSTVKHEDRIQFYSVRISVFGAVSVRTGGVVQHRPQRVKKGGTK